MTYQDSTYKGKGTHIFGVPTAVVAALKAMAATTNYAQYDVMSNSASAGTVWTFAMPEGCPPGATIEIMDALLYAKNTQATHLTRMYLFNSSALNCNLNDNVANTIPVAADMYSGTTPLTKAQKYIDFGALTQAGSGGRQAVVTPGDGKLPLTVQLGAAETNLYGVSVDMSGETAELVGGQYVCALWIRWN